MRVVAESDEAAVLGDGLTEHGMENVPGVEAAVSCEVMRASHKSAVGSYVGDSKESVCLTYLRKGRTERKFVGIGTR